VRNPSVWLRVLAVPGFFAWLVAALLRAQAWWRGELTQPGVLDLVLLGSLPLLAWVYFRHLSVFGKDKGQCLLPGEGAPCDRRDGEQR
jgi:hypothetical protein